jgi:predicted  nucleic acid-binding Zn-ribbon protein
MGSYGLVSAPVSELLELQELDLTIDRLQARLEQLEAHGEITQARATLAEAEARLGELKLSLDAVTRDQRRLESDIDSMDRKIEAERTRLYDGSVANPKELQSIEHEVQGIRGRKSRIEDQLIEQMERREELEGQLPPVEVEAALARERLAEIESTSARELVEVEQQLAKSLKERDEKVGDFDVDLLELYEGLRRQKKGVGAAALIDGVCQGCHQQLSPMYLDRLKRTEGIRRCEHCRRILIFD